MSFMVIIRLIIFKILFIIAMAPFSIAKERHSIIATINQNQLIDTYDLKNYQATIKLISGISLSDKAALEFMIHYRLINEKSKIFSFNLLNSRVDEFVGQIEQITQQQNITSNARKRNINKGLFYQDLAFILRMRNFYQVLETNVSVNNVEIDSSFELLANGTPSKQFVVQEIFIPDFSGYVISSQEIANEISAELKKGASISAGALLLSESNNVFAGAQSLTLLDKYISAGAAKELSQYQVGDITDPIKTTHGYAIYKIVHIATIEPISPYDNSAKNQLSEYIRSYIFQEKYQSYLADFKKTLQEEFAVEVTLSGEK